MQPYQNYSGMMQPQSRPYDPTYSGYAANNFNNYGAIGNYGNSAYPAQRQSCVLGRYVQRFEDILANDVPMDGSYAVFVKGDLSEACAKAWQADGTIKTLYFKPVLDALPNDMTNCTSDAFKLNTEAIEGFRNDILSKLSDMDSRLERIETGFKPTTTRKKEVPTNE